MGMPPPRHLGDIKALEPESVTLMVTDVAYKGGPTIGLPYEIALSDLNGGESYKACAAVGLNPKAYNSKDDRLLAVHGALNAGVPWRPTNTRMSESSTPEPTPEPELSTCQSCGRHGFNPHHVTDTVLCDRCEKEWRERQWRERLPEPTPEPTPAPSDDPLAQLGTILTGLVGTSVDADQVRSIARQVAEEVTADVIRPIQVTVHIPDREPIKLDGRQHFLFSELCGYAGLREHVWLVGPAGSGKTTVAEQVAEALGLSYGAISCSPTMTKSDLFGFIDAAGNEHRTPFTDCIENGGLFLLDEADNGNPNTLTAVNMALANGVCALPWGMTKVNPDFVVFAGANTFGTGAERKYIGRLALDAATLDRFLFVEMPYDEGIELDVAIAHLGGDVARAKGWHTRIKRCRENVETHHLDVVVSPRATIKGAKLLASGVSESRAIEVLIRKGLTDEQWEKVNR
jgi:cobaltochelatase CobS